jgi:organic hydroperoxide reductase OsmC/OhrA
MSEHRIALNWQKGDAPFTYETYSRNHDVAFKAGAAHMTVSAYQTYRGDAARPDPEDLLVASMSSCHMLSFLAIAARKRLIVLSYQDDAVGFLEDDGGRLWITRAILRPKVEFETAPDAQTLVQMHHLAHRECFIANSVKTEIRVEPR